MKTHKNYNLESVKGLILGLIEMEDTLEHKHDLLTDIGIGSRNPITFRACEDIRNELPDSPDQKEGPSSVMASGSTRKKVRNVLHKIPSNAAPGESNTRNELEALLSTLNATKQKTFEFKGVVFALPLIKKFMSECKNLPSLEVLVSETHLDFKWINGSASINSFPVSEKIREEKAALELLK